MGFCRFVVLSSLILGSRGAFAQISQPVSLSYQNLIRCFPELENESISFKVDLNKLKDVVDSKFATAKSNLHQRKVQYLTPSKEKMLLTLRTNYTLGKKPETEMSLQQIDEKGVVTEQALTANQKLNPSQETINNLLLGASIKSDEYTYYDTKLNGLRATFMRNFKDVQEYSLSDEEEKRRVICESRNDLGIICSCLKK